MELERREWIRKILRCRTDGGLGCGREKDDSGVLELGKGVGVCSGSFSEIEQGFL